MGKSIDPPSIRRRNLLEAQRSEFFSKSLDESDSLFLPIKPKETPVRKILTISTLQLHRAINDRINDELMAATSVEWSSTNRKEFTMPEKGGKSRKKVVGGGGIIARYQSPFR